jgi:hypothetical protein
MMARTSTRWALSVVVMLAVLVAPGTGVARAEGPDSDTGAPRILLLQAVTALDTPRTRDGHPIHTRHDFIHRAARDLQDAREVKIADIRLEEGLSVDLDLSRMQLFASRAEVLRSSEGGTERLPLPEIAFFKGVASGYPDSLAQLSVSPRSVYGLIRLGHETWYIEPERTTGAAPGAHLVYNVRRVASESLPPSEPFCNNDRFPGLVEAYSAGKQERASVPSSSVELVIGELAIEADYELRQLFATDQDEIDYIASLVAASSVIYERDAHVRLAIGYLNIWTSAGDPFTATTISALLDEFQSYGINNLGSVSRVAAHLLSGRNLGGGIAYVDVLCSTTFGYGVSANLNGSFGTVQGNDTWDLVVFTHELGHNFSSPHTHCYAPPIDTCYNQQLGCWSGQVTCVDGTIMSYCHLCPGGLGNIQLEFHPRAVSESIESAVAVAPCFSEEGCADVGDPDCNGTLCQSTDVLALVDQVIDREAWICEADVNCDGEVDLFDVVCQIRCMNGLASCLDSACVSGNLPSGCSSVSARHRPVHSNLASAEDGPITTRQNHER